MRRVAGVLLPSSPVARDQEDRMLLETAGSVPAASKLEWRRLLPLRAASAEAGFLYVQEVLPTRDLELEQDLRV